MRLQGFTVLLLLLAAAGCSGGGGGAGPVASDCPEPDPLSVTAPAGFPEFNDSEENPTTVQGVALGRRLFYDPILSGDSTQSCASCHVQENAFGDPRRFSVGIDGIEGDRHAPTIINAAWLRSAFWDGRAPSLEDQAREPVPNPIEMHLEWPDAVDRLQAHPEYPDLFCAAFGDETVTQDRVVAAIAQFERLFISGNSKFDRVERGEESYTEAEQRGHDLFFTEIGDCFHCHGQMLGFDRDFHDIGLADSDDDGRGEITGNPADNGKFKTPALRNVMASAPYMHDGRFETIEDVIAHYNHGFVDGPNVDPLIRARLSRPPMTQGEIDTLIIFLHTFTDTTFLQKPELSNPFEE